MKSVEPNKSMLNISHTMSEVLIIAAILTFIALAVVSSCKRLNAGHITGIVILASMLSFITIALLFRHRICELFVRYNAAKTAKELDEKRAKEEEEKTKEVKEKKARELEEKKTRELEEKKARELEEKRARELEKEREEALKSFSEQLKSNFKSIVDNPCDIPSVIECMDESYTQSEEEGYVFFFPQFKDYLDILLKETESVGCCKKIMGSISGEIFNTCSSLSDKKKLGLIIGARLIMKIPMLRAMYPRSIIMDFKDLSQFSVEDYPQELYKDVIKTIASKLNDKVYIANNYKKLNSELLRLSHMLIEKNKGVLKVKPEDLYKMDIDDYSTKLNNILSCLARIARLKYYFVNDQEKEGGEDIEEADKYKEIRESASKADSILDDCKSLDKGYVKNKITIKINLSIMESFYIFDPVQEDSVAVRKKIDVVSSDIVERKEEVRYSLLNADLLEVRNLNWSISKKIDYINTALRSIDYPFDKTKYLIANIQKLGDEHYYMILLFNKSLRTLLSAHKKYSKSVSSYYLYCFYNTHNYFNSENVLEEDKFYKERAEMRKKRNKDIDNINKLYNDFNKRLTDFLDTLEPFFKKGKENKGIISKYITELREYAREESLCYSRVQDMIRDAEENFVQLEDCMLKELKLLSQMPSRKIIGEMTVSEYTKMNTEIS